MKKPDSYKSLPDTILQSILWDMELDYCPYESSKAETIHSILCGNISSTNELIIKNYYAALSIESLLKIIEEELSSIHRSYSELKQFQTNVWNNHV